MSDHNRSQITPRASPDSLFQTSSSGAHSSRTLSLATNNNTFVTPQPPQTLFAAAPQPTADSRASTDPRNDFEYTPPPSRPWVTLWQCSYCKRMWPLGSIRRCLNDGRRFMRLVPGQARPQNEECYAYIDADGWARHNAWRRKEQAARTLRKEASLGRRGRGDTPDSWSTSSDGTQSVDSVLEAAVARNCEANCDVVGECRRNPAGQRERIRDERAQIEEYKEDVLYGQEGDDTGSQVMEGVVESMSLEEADVDSPAQEPPVRPSTPNEWST